VTTVDGPIVGGTGKPYGGPPDGVPDGYVMEEFLLSGTASSYRPVSGTTPGLDGLWEVEPAEEAEYCTRLYVVRPADPGDFNGVVLVNWQNVTAGVDLGVPPREAYAGYAWVGVTTQRVAIEGQPSLGAGMPATSGLPSADPERYGSLHHPGDAFSYDIFTQAGRLLAPGRVIGVVDPLGGLEPTTILALGGSQSAMRLGSYLNLVHQRERVFDGFFPNVHWGMCPPPPDQSLFESFLPTGDGLTAGSAQIRDDGEVPVLVLCTESEAPNMYPVRQPDTDTFRYWEMAGTAHASGAGFDALIAATEGLNLAAFAEELSPNEVQWDYVADAALRHLVRWVQHGEAPPRFPMIDFDPGPPAAIRRDEFGNAIGGIRLPDLEAATGRHRGSNDANVFAALMGESVPFTAAELSTRYQGGREDYLQIWDGAVDRLETAGLDLGPDAAALRQRGRELADQLFA
jgi:hypothetical protein